MPKLEAASVALLLLLEFWVFSGAFHKYFNHDSLYYMTHIPRSWEQYRPYLAAPSEEKNYRPLNLGFMALVAPFLGLEPYPYHWIPVVFHLVNTLLFFVLLRRILPDFVAAFAGAAFWGLHSVAGWITYDITYLSDFLPAFLLLVSLLLAVEGDRRNSWMWKASSLAFFGLSLFSKEAATTFPLALLIVLVLSDLRASPGTASRRRISESLRRAAPFALASLAMALAFAGVCIHWLRAGALYAQGSASAYDISPWSHLLAKTKYVFWALNLPDRLSIPNAAANYALAFAGMGVLLFVWCVELAGRRFRLSIVECAGVLWFAGLNVPSLLLGARLAKWYLYVPLMGVALAFGALAGNLRSGMAPPYRRAGGLALAWLLIVPVLFASLVQTRSYVAASDSAYQSDILQSCVADFRSANPALPAEVHLFYLPAFEEGISELFRTPPMDRGQPFGLYYPASKFSASFAHMGARLPADFRDRQDIRVLQYLGRRLYDVTGYFKDKGRMTLYLLPTSEGESAPLFKKEPAGGRRLYQEFVQLRIGDEGARLPDDYTVRRDIWILQYMDGRFHDVTRYFINGGKQTLLILPDPGGKLPPLWRLGENNALAEKLDRARIVPVAPDELARLPADSFARPDAWVAQYLGGRFSDVSDYYQGRRRQKAMRILGNLDDIRWAVSRSEFYPDYERFATPTGKPAFFSTPEKDIVTQIGGSTLTVPLKGIPAGARLRFGVSWMFDQGDGGWAELVVRAPGRESVLFRQYMRPDPARTDLQWKEFSVELKAYENSDAELLLKCYNDSGKTTVADWLNWRDLALYIGD